MNRDTVKTWLPGVLLTLAGFLIAYQFVDPAPPRSIVLAAGAQDGAYYLFAQRYREQLAAHGIEVDVRTTNGSIDNLTRLSQGQADVAFIQGGVHQGEHALLSLGSLYFEPLWIFQRAGLDIETLADLEGLRVSIGPEGSGSRAVGLTLLTDNQLDVSQLQLQDRNGQAAAQALLAGDLDLMMSVASAQSPVVQRLLNDPRAHLWSMQRAEAYTRIHRFLSRVVLPQGVINLRDNIPDRDVHMLAATANLVASPELHPALVDLLVQTASRVHGDGGLFEQPGQFPSPDYTDFPLSDDARRFYQSGPPFLQRYLPFWAATMIDRLKVMLLPMIALLIPLFKLMPPIYRWRMRARIYRWYRELEAVDSRINAGTASPGELLGALNDIEQDVVKVAVPLSYAVELYDLRMHMALVRDRLQDKKPDPI